MNILDYQAEPKKEPAKSSQPNLEIIDANPAPAQNESYSTEIAIVDTSPKNALVIFSNGGLDPLIEQIRKRVKSEEFDVTTEKGRERIGSVARQIGSAKQRLIEMADSLTENAKKQIAAVNAERNRAQEEFDKLRDEVLAPRKAYEQIEKDRQAEHNKNLTILEGMIEFADHTQYTVEQIENALNKSSELFFGRQWQEYADKANYANLKNKDALNQAIANRKALDEAEAQKQREAQAAREKEIEDAKIAAAEKAKKDAEELAAAEAKRIADKVEADRVEAERIAKAKADADAAEIARIQKAKDEAEEKRKNLISSKISMLMIQADCKTWSSERMKNEIQRHENFYETNKQSFEEFSDTALSEYNKTKAEYAEVLQITLQNEEKNRIQEENDKKERDAKIAKDAADAEAKRIQDAKDAEESARKLREADEANKQRIIDEISFDLMLIQTAPPITKEEAEAVARALIDGKVRNVIVKF